MTGIPVETPAANSAAFAALFASIIHRRDLGIVLFGDSHFNGTQQTAVAQVDTAGNIGTLAMMSPLDKLWTGTADASVFTADTQINSLTSPNTCNDGHSALGTKRAGPATDMLNILRRSYPQIGQMRLANFAVGGSSIYTWTGEQAVMFTGAFGQATAGDTVTIAGQTYTFRAAPSVAYDVLIGASANESNRNLLHAINATVGQESLYGTGTVTHPTVRVQSPSTTQYGRVVSKLVGSAGNALAVAASNTARITVTNVSLTPVSSGTFHLGSDTSALYANAKSRIPVGFGSVDLVLISLGTNDGQRQPLYGYDVQATYQTFIDNIQADYPAAKIAIARPTPTTGVATYVIGAIDALLAANTDLYSMDMYSLGTGATGLTKILSSDGLHHTQYGYSLYSQLMAKAAASALALV